MNKLNFLVIGSKVAWILLPWLATSTIVSIFNDGYFAFSSAHSGIFMIIGIIMLLLGITLYSTTVKKVLKGIKNTKLVTNGAYRFCQNPLYSFIIFLILPGLALIMNSWLILTSSIVAYIVFKMFIKDEQNELENEFGEEYLAYKRKTSEFFISLNKKYNL